MDDFPLSNTMKPGGAGAEKHWAHTSPVFFEKCSAAPVRFQLN